MVILYLLRNIILKEGIVVKAAANIVLIIITLKAKSKITPV
jgi:hypothetical protein